MKRKAKTQQKQARPGTVTDAKGITLSAGVAVFNAVLDKEDIAAKAAARGESKAEACGDGGPEKPQSRSAGPPASVTGSQCAGESSRGGEI
jgi:hypothetical protein